MKYIDPLILSLLIRFMCSYGSKYMTRNERNLTTAVKSLPFNYSKIKKHKGSDAFLLTSLLVSVQSCKSK